MATLEDFRSWYDRDLSPYAPWDKAVQVDAEYGKDLHLREARTMRVWIFTDKNCYSLTAREPSMRGIALVRNAKAGEVIEIASSAQLLHEEGAFKRMDNGYLGCISTSRKWRAGEDWHRGSDLPDGPLTEETWHRIIARIVSYELVDIVKQRPPFAEPPAEGPTAV